ncbi:MAG: CAP domain-containing protein [Betaproteobacteria bacterium]
MAHLDAVRRAAGAGPLVASDALGASAALHADYLSDNGFHSAATVHAETAGLANFTGADPFVRMRAAGYRLSYATEVVGDIGSVALDTDCVDHLLATIYHAALLLSRVTEAGVAYGEGAGAGMCTIDLGVPLEAPAAQVPAAGELVRYPWPGMATATGTFRLGSENPRPPPSRLPNANVGIPVLVGLRNADTLAAAPGDGRVEIQRFDLDDAAGRPVPSVLLADPAVTGAGVVADVGLHGLFVALVPRIPLAPGRYRVTLHATIGGTHVVAPAPWSFTVGTP